MQVGGTTAAGQTRLVAQMVAPSLAGYVVARTGLCHKAEIVARKSSQTQREQLIAHTKCIATPIFANLERIVSNVRGTPRFTRLDIVATNRRAAWLNTCHQDTRTLACQDLSLSRHSLHPPL